MTHVRTPSPARRNVTHLLFCAVIVGLVAGVGATIFYRLLHLFTALFQQSIVGYQSPEALGEPALFHFPVATYRPWLWIPVMALGALVSSLLVQKYAPEAAGHGTDAAIFAYHFKDGYVRTVVPVVKTIASALTIGSGGSGGREGPIAQIGAGFGSWLGRTLDLPVHERRVLMAAGMGAGVGAIFKAPLAGAIFAGEILYSSLQIEHEVLLPALVASIVSFSVFGSIFGWQPLFRVPDVSFRNPLELILYTILGLAAAFVGGMFVKMFYFVHNQRHRMRVPVWFRPVIGAILTGAVAFYIPEAVATGYGSVQEAILGHKSAGPLLVLSLLRIFTTSSSIGTGGSGGVFGPAMVIGGCLGGSMGMFFSQMFPSLAPNPAAFVMVGMTGFFAGIAHAPISTIIMVSEMTGNYRLLVPAMWVSAITFTVAGRWSLYREQVPGSRESGAHRGEFARAVFDDELVGEHMVTTIETVRDHELLGHALNRIASGTHRRFPVVDEIGRPIGLFKRSYSLRFETQERPIRDVMTTPVARLIPGQTLGEAASQLANPDIGLVVVIDPQNDQLVGVLSRGDLLRVYQHRVHEESRTNLGNAVALAKEVPDPAPRFPAGR